MMTAEGHTDLARLTKEEMPVLFAVLKQYKRESKSRRMKALREPQLMEMFKLLDPSDHDNRCFRTIIAMCHNTIRRVGDVIRKDCGGMRANMIYKGTQGLTHYVFRKSKTNRNRKIQTATMWCNCPRICAKCELARLIELRPWKVTEKSKLLRMTGGGTMTYNMIQSKIKELVEAIGLNPKGYGTHSLRRGGLQDAEERGDGDEWNEDQGFWAGERGKQPYKAKDTVGKAIKRKQTKWARRKQRK